MVCYRDLLTGIKAHRAFFPLLILSAILFLTNIGVYGQFLRAESNFSLGARMMLETNEFLLPHAPHELPLNKPPLQYWLIGISYRMFGFSHGAGRIPSALCGLGVITLVYILGLRLRDKTLGLTASAMLATSYIFWSFARLSMPDMLLTLCVTAALVCWMLVLTDRTARPCALTRLGYVAVAVGFLAKGPVAIALSVLPVLLAVVVARDVTLLKRLRPVSGALVFLLVATPYFLLVYAQDGLEPLRNFFVDENMRRFTGTTYQSSRPPIFLYEVTAFFADFAPWSPLLAVTACSFARWSHIDPATQRHLQLLFMWMIAPIVLFSVSSFKLDYYFLPSLPAAALLVAQSLLQKGPLSRWPRWVRFTIGVLSVILLSIVLIFTIQIIEVNFPDVRVSWLPHAIAIMTLLPAVVFAIRRWVPWALLAISFTLWATTVTAYLVLLPSYSRFLPAAQLAASVPAASEVYTSARAGRWALDLALYLPTAQPVRSLSGDLDNSQLGEILRTHPVALALIYESDYVELHKAGMPLRVLSQAEATAGPRLTLKALLHPSREMLYVVSK